MYTASCPDTKHRYVLSKAEHDEFLTTTLNEKQRQLSLLQESLTFIRFATEEGLPKWVLDIAEVSHVRCDAVQM